MVLFHSRYHGRGNDWQDYFESEKAEIAVFNQQITQHEAELNQEVYHIIDLTPEEIFL